MKVSFVIPTWNQAQFIRRCIDGCLAQTIAGSEIRVLDALSTDGTQEILAEYGERIRWRSEKDGGQSDAVNQGVAQSSGEIIAWINSDDCYAAPDVLARVLRHFDADPDLDILYGDGVMIDVEGRPIRPYPRARHSLAQGAGDPSGEPAAAAGHFFSAPAVYRRGRARPRAALDARLRSVDSHVGPREKDQRYLPETLAHATYHSGAKSITGHAQTD